MDDAMTQAARHRRLFVLPVAALFGLVAYVVTEATAQACQTAKVCVTAPVMTDDLEVSDYPTDLQMKDGMPIAMLPVRGVRMMLIPPAPEMPRTVFADADGCITFESQFTHGFKALIYPEALIGENRNIHVRAFPTHAQYVAETNSLDPAKNPSPAGIPLAPWLCHVDHMAESDVEMCELPEEDLSRLLTLTLDTMERIDKMTDPRFSQAFSFRTYTLAPSEDDPFAGIYDEYGFGAYGTSEVLYLGHQAVHKKFVYSHELGHGFFSRWGGSFQKHEPEQPIFGYEEIDDACKFVAVNSNSLHGIRSAEYGRDAYTEGFAQFVSVIAFDDPSQPDALFQYYKEINIGQVPAYQDFVEVGNSMISMIGGDSTALGGQSAWVETMCEEDWTYEVGPPPGQLVEISSEIDWMRFLWQFWSLDLEIGGQPTDKPTLWEMFRMNKYVQDAALVPNWNGVYTVMSDDTTVLFPYLDRFEVFALENGVNNGAHD